MSGGDPACFDAGNWRDGSVEAPSLRLRPPVIEDARAIADLADDHDVARWTADLPHPLDEAGAVAMIERMAEGRALEREWGFVLERRRDSDLVGAAGFKFKGEDAEIRYWIGSRHQRMGYALETVRGLTRLLFAHFDPPRILAEVMAENAASERVLERAGFVRTGQGTGCGGRCEGVAIHHWTLARDDWLRRWWARPILLVSAVAMVDADGRVLLAQRPEGKALAGLWEFPGGKVHEGETPEAALIRELEEELGVDVRESCLAPLSFASHDYDDFHLLMPVFACRVWKGTPTAREGQALRWVRPVRMADLPMPPADLPLVALIRDFLG